MDKLFITSKTALRTSAYCFFLLFCILAKAEAGSGQMTILMNHGKIIHIQQAFDAVFVADPTIVDYHTKSPHQIYLFAKKIGRTSFYVTDKSGRIVSRQTLEVIQDLGQLQQILHEFFPHTHISVAPVGDKSIAVHGLASSPNEAENIRLLVAKFAGDPKNVINLLSIAAATQINLRVEIVEMNRSLERSLGLNWFAKYTGKDSGAQLTTTLIPSAFTTLPLLDTVDVAGNILRGNFSVNSLIHLLENNNLLTILSEPNLTALSGETASFLVGGEFPIVVPQGVGTAPGIVFKQYGVSLAFSPTLLNQDKINIQIKSEVSQLSTVGAVQIQGYQIPGLTTRRAKTTIELHSGQSFAIAGLLQHTNSKLIEQLPGLGDVPVLGALFRSQEFKRNETELVIIVTPYLVQPIGSNQVTTSAQAFQNDGPANRSASTEHRLGADQNIGFIL